MVGFSKAGWQIMCLGHVQIKTINQLYLRLVTGYKKEVSRRE
jgi:hypothetical protein